MFKSPFSPSSSSPGTGQIALTLLPPNTTPTLTKLSYQYPLKLVAPLNTTSSTASSSSNNTNSLLIFLLSYGGGLVAGDTITLSINLDPRTRLTLLTQGSTKIFKTPSRDLVTRQVLDVDIGAGAALCYLPDPCQPFGSSCFEQRQLFSVVDDYGKGGKEEEEGGGGGGGGGRGSSLCVLDWVSEGRRARGEKWDLYTWKGRNEVRSKKDGRLLLRDVVILEDGKDGGMGTSSLAEKTAEMGVIGTLILYGDVFHGLADFFMHEFETLPRIGGRNWGGGPTAKDEEVHVLLSPAEKQERERTRRYEQGKKDGLLWTAARVRGFVLVKFGASEVEGARRWLREMILAEGSVGREFGEQALLCLR